MFYMKYSDGHGNVNISRCFKRQHSAFIDRGDGASFMKKGYSNPRTVIPLSSTDGGFLRNLLLGLVLMSTS